MKGIVLYKLFGFLMTVLISVNAFADVELFLPNTVIQNGCVAANTSVFSGGFEMIPVYENETYTCSAGSYLPAGAIECAPCPENSYCGGGEYTFNETAADGIATCANGLVAPAGSTSAGECGIKMRIGDDVLYLATEQKTTPALAVRVDGVIYYANATPVENGARVVSHGAESSLRVMIDGVEYSIHDNTSKGEE